MIPNGREKTAKLREAHAILHAWPTKESASAAYASALLDLMAQRVVTLPVATTERAQVMDHVTKHPIIVCALRDGLAKFAMNQKKSARTQRAVVMGTASQILASVYATRASSENLAISLPARTTVDSTRGAASALMTSVSATKVSQALAASQKTAQTNVQGTENVWSTLQTLE